MSTQSDNIGTATELHRINDLKEEILSSFFCSSDLDKPYAWVSTPATCIYLGISERSLNRLRKRFDDFPAPELIRGSMNVYRFLDVRLWRLRHEDALELMKTARDRAKGKQAAD